METKRYVHGMDEKTDATKRVVISRDEGWHEWVRDEYDPTFTLWSNLRGHRGDKDAENPLEETDEGVRPREGLLAIPVDVYKHGLTMWFIRGRPPVGVDAWDSTIGRSTAPFYLYCDKRRWEERGGSAKWEFVDGKPSEELLRDAQAIASQEVEEMNLCSSGSYYSYRIEELTRKNVHTSTKNMHTGSVDEDDSEEDEWEVVDEMSGVLIENPLDYLDGVLIEDIPVYSEDGLLVNREYLYKENVEERNKED